VLSDRSFLIFRGNLQPTSSGFIISTYKTETLDFPKKSPIFYQNIRHHMLGDSKILLTTVKSSNPLCGFVCFREGAKSPPLIIDDYLFLISPPLVLHSFHFVLILFYCFAITDKIKICLFTIASHIN
jgi:hypothetical protein